MLRIQPFGVLGKQLTREKKEVIRGEDPADLDSCCIVDPAGLHHIIPPGGPMGAGGAAGAVYRWLGISESLRFTEDIIEGVTQTGEAKYRHYRRYRYGVLDKHVIHAVGPDLRLNPDLGEAERLLTAAYHHIFSEFVNSRRKVLRLLPVSSGIFSGAFKKEMPELTVRCMRLGFSMLEPPQRDALRGCELHLCIFMEKELPAYQAAAKAMAGDTSNIGNKTIGVYHAFEDPVDETLVDLSVNASEMSPSLKTRWGSSQNLAQNSGSFKSSSFTSRKEDKVKRSGAVVRSTSKKSPSLRSSLSNREKKTGRQSPSPRTARASPSPQSTKKQGPRGLFDAAARRSPKK